jgi:hypothetical protein
VLQYVSLGSVLSLRSGARMGCAVSVTGHAVGASTCSFSAQVALGSVMSSRAYARLGPAASLPSLAQLGSVLSLRSLTRLGSCWVCIAVFFAVLGKPAPVSGSAGGNFARNTVPGYFALTARESGSARG